MGCRYPEISFTDWTALRLHVDADDWRQGTRAQDEPNPLHRVHGARV